MVAIIKKKRNRIEAVILCNLRKRRIVEALSDLLVTVAMEIAGFGFVTNVLNDIVWDLPIRAKFNRQNQDSKFDIVSIKPLNR